MVENEVSHEELLKKILAEHKVFEGILTRLEEIVKNIALSQIESRIYYNTPFRAIVVATPNPAPGFVTDPYMVTDGVIPGYQLEEIYTQLGRIARKITMINDGTDTIYVIVSSDGVNWSVEAPVIPGEVRNFYNVWNMGLRSPTAGVLATFTGGVYRLSEFDFSSTVYCRNKNLPTFLSMMINAPLVGVNLPNIVIPDGFHVVIKANVNNGAGLVYLASPTAANTAIVNTGIAANRFTLAANDVVHLRIQNTLIGAVRGSTGAENVDIIVEQTV